MSKINFEQIGRDIVIRNNIKSLRSVVETLSDRTRKTEDLTDVLGFIKDAKELIVFIDEVLKEYMNNNIEEKEQDNCLDFDFT